MNYRKSLSRQTFVDYRIVLFGVAAFIAPLAYGANLVPKYDTCNEPDCIVRFAAITTAAIMSLVAGYQFFKMDHFRYYIDQAKEKYYSTAGGPAARSEPAGPESA